jgi:small-conductance mechanosensitive channel
MVKNSRTLPLLGLLVLLVAVGVGLQLTRDRGQITAPANKSAAGKAAQVPLVDTAPFDTARQLANLVTTPEEDEFSRQAVRVADHEVDLAFAMALFRARSQPLPPDPKTKQIQDRIRTLNERIQADQNDISQLKQLASKAKPAGAEDVQQRLDFAQARLALHQDDLEEATQNLIRSGGNTEAQVQRMLDEHQARQHPATPAPSVPAKLSAFQLPTNLLGQFRVWRDLRGKEAQLQTIQQQAGQAAQELSRKHDELERQLPPAPANPAASSGASNPSTPTPPPVGAASPAPGPNDNGVAALKAQSDTRKLLIGYDKRIQDEQQLARIYGDWAGLLARWRQSAVHSLLQLVAWILLILLAIVVAKELIDKVHARLAADQRRLRTLRLVLHFAADAAGILLILVVVFGMPSQLSTIVALAGAGLTVALKDFIVAFFGWFVLMGRNGMRTGDWVEINGIGGEVIEVGLLHTVLLETGNWTDAGHPTGRKVTFVNSFAIEGHYFNFSTTGQWLWDELEVLLPAGQDPYPIIETIRKIVTAETEAHAALAQKEWQGATRHYHVQSFSTVPAISLRPTNMGLNMVVRYVTPAHSRYDVRARLFQSIVGVLHERTSVTPASTPAVAGASGRRISDKSV